MKCEICKNSFEYLGYHIKKHGSSLKEYYDKYLRNEKEAARTCRWCGNILNFVPCLKDGYQKKFCSAKCSTKAYWADPSFGERKYRNKAVKKWEVTCDDEIFCVDTKCNSNYIIKRELIKRGYEKDVCFKCGQPPVWKNLPLVLQLHHKNGNKRDARLCNLSIICPNCHTQTRSFNGRNKKRLEFAKREFKI